MIEEKMIIRCGTCSSPIHVEAKRHIELVYVGLRQKEPQAFYSVAVKCPCCGYEQAYSHMSANECPAHIIDFIEKGSHASFEDTSDFLMKLGYTVDENGYMTR